MAKKIRHHKSQAEIRELFNQYFHDHQEEVVKHLLDKVGISSLDGLYEYEYNNGFGFDCGWVWLYPIDSEMRHEWELDNGKYDIYVTCLDYPYNNQSTTCKCIELQKALDDLKLNDLFRTYVRLD